MSHFLRVFLPSYFLVYFLITFLLKSVIVARQVGYNPVVLPASDDAYGLIGHYFKVTLAGLFLYVLVYAFGLAWHPYFGPVYLLDGIAIKYTGILMLVTALIWTIVAQAHMKASWRIGIDTQHKTSLITTGLFFYSRNPVFLGMLTSLLGLFLVTPNLIALFLLILAYVLIQLQIRLEEAHLSHVHGLVYTDYAQKTRRLLGRKSETNRSSVVVER